MLKRTLLLCILFLPAVLRAQVQDTIPGSVPDDLVVNYSATPKKYYIADIDITGVEGTMYENQKFTLVGFSGLQKGQQIQIPGEDISNVIKKFWKQGLFSDTKVLWSKIEGDSIWLEIRLTDRPRLSSIRYLGVKKSEQDDAGEIGLCQRQPDHPFTDRPCQCDDQKLL